jgi:hypothetical protein
MVLVHIIWLGDALVAMTWSLASAVYIANRFVAAARSRIEHGGVGD